MVQQGYQSLENSRWILRLLSPFGKTRKQANKNCLGQIHSMIISYEVALDQIHNAINFIGERVRSDLA